MVAVMVCFTSLTAEQKEMAVQTGIKPYSWDEFLHLVSFHHSVYVGNFLISFLINFLLNLVK